MVLCWDRPVVRDRIGRTHYPQLGLRLKLSLVVLVLTHCVYACRDWYDTELCNVFALVDVIHVDWTTLTYLTHS